MGISDRQLEIIEAAGRIMTEAGVSGLTTKNLSKEMGFSEAAIYRHFDSKEKIIVAMLEYVAKQIDERYNLTIIIHHSPEQNFITLIKNHFSFFSESPHFTIAVFSDGQIGGKQLINEAILKVMAVKIKYLRPIIEDGQKQGVFKKTIPTDDVVHIVMGAIRLMMYKWRVTKSQFDIIKKGDELIDSLLTLIKSEK